MPRTSRESEIGTKKQPSADETQNWSDAKVNCLKERWEALQVVHMDDEDVIEDLSIAQLVR